MNITAAALFALVSAVTASKFNLEKANEAEILASQLNELHGLEVYPKLERTLFNLPENYDTIVALSGYFPELKNVREAADLDAEIIRILKKSAAPAAHPIIDENLKRNPKLAIKELVETMNSGNKSLVNTVTLITADPDQVSVNAIGAKFPEILKAVDSSFFAFDDIFNYATTPLAKRQVQKVDDNDRKSILRLLHKAVISAAPGATANQIHAAVLEDIVKLAPTLPSAPVPARDPFYQLAEGLRKREASFATLSAGNAKAEFSRIVLAHTTPKYANLIKSKLTSNPEQVAKRILDKVNSGPTTSPISDVAFEIVIEEVMQHLKAADGVLASIPTDSIAKANAFIRAAIVKTVTDDDLKAAVNRRVVNTGLAETCAGFLGFPADAKNRRAAKDIKAALEKTREEALTKAIKSDLAAISSKAGRMFSPGTSGKSFEDYVHTPLIKPIVDGLPSNTPKRATFKTDVEAYLKANPLVLTDMVLQELNKPATIKTLAQALGAVRTEILNWNFN
ncbi:hypothetical protein PSACC_01614 [Paramicrosporidium saccamoebae]|uniref:Uncharacterized protein n=1 Tax=Paramicrosporidium saccamoebae TaxID=1246581 RepID=A0A2H9TLG6_9FUNG|nr:hypothetical protein PSACC_01614 [Paramicrosporidium saccamoebae]